MNNKQIGTAFERELCEILAKKGYWVHFITPDARGAQPFDIIAVRDGKVMAIDCKTCVAKSFNISRLEDNQRMAFDKWMACGNDMPWVAVKHENKIYMVSYPLLKELGSIRLEKLKIWMEVEE